MVERARLAKDSLDATRAGSVSPGERMRKEAEAKAVEAVGENAELEALFAVEAYAASLSSVTAQAEAEAEARRREEEERRRAALEARRREEQAAARAEAEAKAKQEEEQRRREEEQRRREEEQRKRELELKAQADALYRSLAAKKMQEQADKVRADAEATLARCVSLRLCANGSKCKFRGWGFGFGA